MRRRGIAGFRVLAVALVGVGCLALSGSASSARPLVEESWYMADQGWRALGRRIEASEDGGISWHVIHRDVGGRLVALLRTGPSAGLFVASTPEGPRTFWTADNGRRWVRTQAIRRPNVRGNSRFLFWWEAGRLYRVQPWFAHRYRCQTTKGLRTCGFLDRPDRRRRPTLHSRKVLDLTGQAIVGAAVIPGGVVAVTDQAWAAWIRWVGPGGTARRTVARLPGPETLSPCRSDPFVSWPVVVVLACRRGGRPGPQDAVTSWLLEPRFVAGAGEESFYDAEHGWRNAPSGFGIEETEDGGAHWQTLASGDFGGPVRTGLRSGVSGYEYSTLWTNNSGLNWYETRRIGGNILGSGRYLLWTSRHALYRIRPWPVPQPRSEHCRGFYVCPLLTAQPSFTDSTREITGASMIPGGVVLSLRRPRSGGDSGMAVVRWLDDGRTPTITHATLPQPQQQDLVPCRSSNAIVNWPLLIVPACAEGQEGEGDLHVPNLWLSSDKGQSWQLIAG